MSRTLKITALALLGVVILWACGGGEVADPKTSGEKFLKAYLTNDFSGAKDFATKETDEVLDQMSTSADDSKKGDLTKLTVGAFTETGDNGTLAYNYEGKDLVLKMKKEDGKWAADMTKDELSAINGASNPASDLTKGLESAMEGIVDSAAAAATGGTESHGDGHSH
jgi:hypothetical protein